MRIAIVTALWKRPELSKIVLDYYANNFPNISPLAVVSDDESAGVCAGADWPFCYHDNQPLSQKFNYVFSQAKHLNPDAVIIIGSDDLLSPELIEYYQKNYSPDADHILGLKDLYFYHAKRDWAIHHKGFIANKTKYTIGCGRIFSRAVLDKLNWQPWGDENINRGLDLTCSRRLEKLSIGERQVTMAESGIAVDIKFAENLTRMETFNFNFETVDVSILKNKFPEQFKAIADATTCNVKQLHGA